MERESQSWEKPGRAVGGSNWDLLWDHHWDRGFHLVGQEWGRDEQSQLNGTLARAPVQGEKK